jgi:hypothetical protein
MKRGSVAILAGVIVLAIAGAILAEEYCTVVINYEVDEINAIDTNVALVDLVIDTATAGSAPDPAIDTTTVTYMITSNGGTDAHKITGVVDDDMDAIGLLLEVALAAPTGALSPGYVEMLTSASDLVTGIDSLNETGLQVSFRLTATSTTPPVVGSTTLTLTIVNT